MKKSRFAALAALAASPQARRLVQQAREKLDTPENRKKATDAFARFKESRAKGRQQAAR